MKKILILSVLMVSTLIMLSGCGIARNIAVYEDVNPWEKSILGKPAMQFPQDAMHAFADEHIYFSKEASSGGSGVGGGGCGCN